jgi:hypothetical protein
MKNLKLLSISIILVIVLLLGGLSFNVSASPLKATSPLMGVADAFSILAETNITNVPVSSIQRNVGLSPATGAGVGLTAAEVGGSIIVVDAFGPGGSINNPTVAGQAISAMMATYTAIDQPCTTTYAGTQDLTLVSPLVAGVYCADAFLLTGNLTLSGTGVWIFKSASSLTTSPSSSVTGGDPCNVWWRLVSDATLDTDTVFVGNILAGTAINLNTRASLAGRAFAQSAVNLQQNVITTPLCTVVQPPQPTAVGVGGLPDTGGAPIRSESFPWMVLIIGLSSLGAVAVVFGIRASRKSYRSK